MELRASPDALEERKYMAPTGNRTTIPCKSNPGVYSLHRQNDMQTCQKLRYLPVQILDFVPENTLHIRASPS